MNIFNKFKEYKKEKNLKNREEYLSHWYRDVYFLIAVTPCFKESPYRTIQSGDSYILAKGDEQLYRVYPKKKQAWPMIAEKDIFFEDQTELYNLLKLAFNTNKSLWDNSFNDDGHIFIQSSKTRRAYIIHTIKDSKEQFAITICFDNNFTKPEDLERLEENGLLYDNSEAIDDCLSRI